MVSDSFKIVNIGTVSVGKSSILLKYIKDEFRENISNTIGIDNYCKEVMVDNKMVKLSIWDTAGQEMFGPITRSYSRGAQGYIFVYDLTDPWSFSYIQKKIALLENGEVAVIAGNKCDLITDENILRERKEELRVYAESVGHDYFITSAKKGTNIYKVFETIAASIQERMGGDVEKGKKRNSFFKRNKNWCC